jgi:hypothetical protein
MTRDEDPHQAEARDPKATLVHLTERELALRWRVSPRTLERWRISRTGPAWLRLNGRVRYRLADVLAFEQLQLRRAAP